MLVYNVVVFTTELIPGSGDWLANVARCDVTGLEVKALSEFSEELPHIYFSRNHLTFLLRKVSIY